MTIAASRLLQLFFGSSELKAILLAFHVALVDEICDDYNLNDLLRQTGQPLLFNQLFCALISGSEYRGVKNVELECDFGDFYFPSKFPEERMSYFSRNGAVNRFYFRRLYRNPLQISKLCTQVRRQLDYRSTSISSLPWAMSTDNGSKVTSRKHSINFVSHQNFTLISKESLRGKTTAIVEIGRGGDLVNYFPNSPVNLFHIDKLENANAEVLEFTGVEFDVVYISFCLIGHDINRHEWVKVILYNALSRSRDSVIVLFHEEDWEIFDKLQKYTEMDVVLDNLSKSKPLSQTELKLIDSRWIILQAIKIVIVSKDLSQFKILLPVIAKFKDANFHQSVQSLLASCFTWCEKGNILEMLRLFRSETETKMSQENGWRCLSNSLLFVAGDWSQTLRRHMLDKFLKVTQMSLDKLNFENEYVKKPESILSNCWVAESEYLLQSFRTSQPSEILFLFIVRILKFRFDGNYFLKIIKTLFGEEAISIDVESAWRAFVVGETQEENFGIVIDLMKEEALKVFTYNLAESTFPLIFHYFQRESFGTFKNMFLRIRRENIRLSEILDLDRQNILWYTAWGDCNFRKTCLVLQDAFEQKNDELETLLLQKIKRDRVPCITTVCMPMIQ